MWITFPVIYSKLQWPFSYSWLLLFIDFLSVLGVIFLSYKLSVVRLGQGHHYVPAEFRLRGHTQDQVGGGGVNIHRIEAIPHTEEYSQGEIFKKWDEPFKKISLRGFYIFGIPRTSRFHFCMITFNKGGGIFLICIFPKWPSRLFNTQWIRHISTCTTRSWLIFRFNLTWFMQV